MEETIVRPQFIMKGRRLTLPKEFMEYWNLQEGDLIQVIQHPNRTLEIYPVELKQRSKGA